MRKYLLLLLIPALHACSNATTYDTIIRNAMIYDGNGGAPYKGDMAINADTIAAMGDLEFLGGWSSMAHSYSPSRMYPKTGPGWRCGMLACPGSSVTSTVVALTTFPSTFSEISRSETTTNFGLPLAGSCCPSVIPPAIAITINARCDFFMSFAPIRPFWSVGIFQAQPAC